MNDYYEPHPRVCLARPLVLGGQLGCGSRMIARIVCARTGLRFVEVDRQIEHEAGRDLSAIAEREGPTRIAERARAVLERIALRPPWAVVALDHAWPSTKATYLFGRRMDFVRVDRPARYLAERAEKEILNGGRWLIGDRPLVMRNEADLAPLWSEREPVLREAGILLDAGERHAHRVAEIVIESLESLTGARAL